jgi:hypothetical protein
LYLELHGQFSQFSKIQMNFCSTLLLFLMSRPFQPLPTCLCLDFPNGIFEEENNCGQLCISC